MNPVMSRRRLLMGASLFGGAAALQSMTGGSVRLLNSAMAEIGAPAVPIRMSSNENPWGPSKLAIAAMEQAFDQSNLYGGIAGKIFELQSRIEGVPASHITMSAGSGEILQAAGVLAALEPGSVVAPYPTFSQSVRAAE